MKTRRYLVVVLVLKWGFDIFEGEGHVPVKGFYQGLMKICLKIKADFNFKKEKSYVIEIK